MKEQFTVSPSEAGQRLDIFCAGKLPTLSRASLQKNIKEGKITANHQMVKPSHLIQANDSVQIEIDQAPPAAVELPIPSIPILYENKDIVVVAKPAGITTHPDRQATAPSVTSWLTDRYPQAASVGEDLERPGVVHRLDKDTSGVLILAKTQSAFDHLKQQFKKRRAKKEYLALVFGVPKDNEGRITRPLARSRRNPLRRTINPAGRPAITEWKLEEKFGDSFALLRVFPFTGRTHQIRVHLHFLGFPIVGDALYVFKRQRSPQGVARQLLHAVQLTIELPSGERKTFQAPLPDDFTSVLSELRTEVP